MASSQTASKHSSAANDNDAKCAKQGRVYENLSLLLLAKNGYELSKDNAKFRDFSIGREIKNLGRDMKFDDNVFRYTEEDGSKNFIFVQVKHIQKDHRIDSRDLSVRAARAERGKGLGKSREFNLQKYFISFLSVREELDCATSEELRDGVIKYVAIFTNAGLDAEELRRKGFRLKEAPEDIAKLFTVKSQEAKDCYQICNVSKHLHDVLMKSSNLLRLAREIAPYVVWKSHRDKNIMKNDTSPLNHYHVPLAREVFQKSAQSAQFREDFLENGETGSKQELRSALFEAIRELDASKKSLDDEELKKLLKGIKWKIDPNFGKTGKDEEINFPSKWKKVEEEDIKDFLKCLVLIVNRPRVEDLEAIILRLVQDTMVDSNYSTSLRYIVDKLDKTFPELKEHVERDLGIYQTTNFEEGWSSGEEIVKLIEKQKQQIGVSFFATAMTLMYESEIMQFGQFKESQTIETCLENFFSSSSQILCVESPQTLLSSIKILQCLNSKKDYIAEDGRIYANFDILKSKENRDSLASAFELEGNVLLVIEHRHAVSEQDVEEFYKKVCSVVNDTPYKKIIIIVPEDEQNILLEKIQNYIQNKDNFMLEDDVIDVKYFDPKEDPFKKEVILSQGQDKRLSLCDITGIASWASYVESFSHGTNRDGVMDGMTLVKILNNDEMEVGNKPAGTSTLGGAYAQTYEEINVETLVDRLTSREDENDAYVVSGISGSSKLEKINKLIQYLGLSNSKGKIHNQLGDVGSDGTIQIADGPFKHKDFRSFCHRYPKKRIFWISVKWENDVMKLILQETYNPNFYLKRKFRDVIIKKDLKELLIKQDLSETFIFHCVEDKQKFYKLMELNESEKEQFENNCKIRIFSQKSEAEATFRQLCGQNKTIHSLEVKNKQLVWCESHGSVECLQEYIDQKQSERFLIEEDKLIPKIRDSKGVIFADDPGMGKTTTLIKLYEAEIEPYSIIKSHWVIHLKLRDHLEALLDHEFEKDGIGTLDAIEFLSNIDSELNNNLAKNLLKIVLDKSKSFLSKPLLLIFDGFDEVLDEVCRHRIVCLLQFLKDETAAKIWITTRCHFQKLLEEKLSTISIQFSPMDDAESAQYIATYLKHRLYLILNNDKYIDLFDTENENQIDGKIHAYAAAFIKKMKSIFRGDISKFIGTPLQLYLMLEGAITDFKIWIERGGDKIALLDYVRNDVFDVYEYFVNRKYDIYFLKIGIRESARLARQKVHIDREHQDFAVSKIRKVNAKSNFEQLIDVFLLVGVIQSQGNDMEFIHKTFEEFFVSKACIDWIKNVPEKNHQKYLLTVILLKLDYQVIRTFIDFQLQKLKKQYTEGDGQGELDESLRHYGKTLTKLLSKENSPLIGVNGTPLHIAVFEGNKNVVWFLLKSLEGHPVALRKFLFTAGEFINRNNIKCKGTALHLACCRDDVEIVKVLLDKERIPEDILQDFLKCLDDIKCNALLIAAINSNNDQIFKELLRRANNKLDLILTDCRSALCGACFNNKEELVDLLLQEFQHEKHSLKKLLLHNDSIGNALRNARSINIVEKLVAAAKSIEDHNETLKKMLLSEEGDSPLKQAFIHDKKDKVEMLLNAAKEIDDDNQTLIQLLLNERYKTTPLHVAAKYGDGDTIKLLLETASDLGLDTLEKLITAVDENGKNAIELMFERGHEAMFDDFYKMLEEDKYENIQKKVMEMYDSVPLESRLQPTKEELSRAIDFHDIEEIKNILSNAKDSSDNPNECLRILLSDALPVCKRFLISCPLVDPIIIEELLSNAMDVDDGGATLKALLTNIYCYDCRYGCEREVKQTVERFIFDPARNNRQQAINTLEEIKEQLNEE